MSEANSTNRFTTKRIAKIAILAALAVIVMLFEIPLPIAPSFYKLGLDEVVVMIGGFALGPWAAIMIEAFKILLNLLINGTMTFGIGELANFIMGCSFVLPACIIYRKHKTKKTAMIGLVVGCISLIVVGALTNLFVVLPIYGKVGMPIEQIIQAGQMINPSINSLLSFVIIITVPFNLIKGVLSSIIVLLVYKRISPILHH
ncbi:MAG: ECF transporter S component [Erysipelotrichaceae bacterium]